MKWSKIALLFCMWFMASCYKEEIEPIPQPKPVVDIFTQQETTISDGEEIMFKLASDSTFILKLVDKASGQVLSKEKILGKSGANNFKIYTKSLESKYLYLVLEGNNKKEISKTTLIVK